MHAGYRASMSGVRLSPGRNGLSRARVTEIQRGRLIAALLDAVDECGYAQLTVGKIISRARVSRKTFYDLFADREDCFLAAFDHVVDDVREQTVDAFDTQPDWQSGVRAALASLLSFIDSDVRVAKVCLIEALQAGPPVLARRDRVIDELALALDAGRTPRRYDPPDVTAKAAVGGVLAVLHSRLLEDAGAPTIELLGALMAIIMLPYRGEAAAAREARTPAPAPSEPVERPGPTNGGDPLKGLRIRLTYRTIRVLMAIAANPGASNRELADAADIADQGQISKLLTRLSGLELIENRGQGQLHGAPNAWWLTPRGARLEKATRPR
jgi:AcrR family transcriptional regulator